MSTPDGPLGDASTVLIVGAGLAGLRTAAELRGRGFAGELTVVGAEPLPPYDRPPLSKELLTRSEPAWLADDGLGDVTELADRLLLEHRAVALRATDDAAEVEITGPEGTATLRADIVVLALGARAVTAPAWRGAHTLHTAADATRLREVLIPGARLVIVGAGWIGAEVAGVAAAHGCAVTVVEAGPTPLARQVGPAIGGRTVSWYAEAGVDLRCAAPVRDIRAGEVLLDEETLPADVVLAATGVRPATDWLEGVLPLTPAGAVPVDAVGRVDGGPGSANPWRSVRAVGDCAEVTTPELGTVPGGHWDAALTQPAALAAALLGEEPAPPAAPYVFSTQLGHDLALVGRPEPRARILDRDGPEGWTALYVEDAPGGAVRLRAGFAVDRPRDVGPLRRLLAAGAAPLLDPSLAGDVATPLKRAVLGP